MKNPLVIALVTAVSAARAWAGEPKPEEVQFFEQKIRPLLVENCYDCHSAQAKKVKGGLMLDTRAGWEKGGDSGEPAAVPGEPEKSPLLKAVRHEDPDSAMPPKRPKLPDSAIADLTTWIKMGAPDPRTGTVVEAKRGDKSWWSLQPLARTEPPIPDGVPASWNVNPIDRFVGAKLAENGLVPSPPASPREFIRRVTYDITGLPPAPEEVEAFVHDSAPGDPAFAAATEELVDRLLASPRYGEQWGRHWLDVVRFGESNGFERNFIYDNAWPFRDYVIRSFNEDKPFNQFIVEHLAGDVVAQGQPDTEVGVAFLTIGPFDDVGNQDVVAAANIRAATVDDMITATGSAFLGLTINCARCHNHKFDPVPTEDYYRIKAAFDGVSHGVRELASEAERKQRSASLAPLERERATLTVEQSALEKTKAELAQAVPVPEGAEQPGRAASATQAQARLDEIKGQLAALQGRINHVPALPMVWAGRFQQPSEHTVVFKGGDPTRRGEEVKPGSLSVLDQTTQPYELPADAPEAERRLALGKWIASDANPLTARVIVNRLWQHHFGTGLVDSPSDFGFLGSRPSHPELLDWLALRLQEKGWHLKALHREIVLSQAYRQSSIYRAEAAAVDKEARLLWRFPPRRLAAEEIRDTMLQVAGKLELRMGGPGFRLYDYKSDNVSTYTPLDKVGPETYRRAVYHQTARASIVDILSDFDLPDNAFPASKRARTTTPLQALALWNGAFTLDLADALAARLSREAGPEPGAQVQRAMGLAFQRSATPAEEAAAVPLIQKSGLPAFCRALLNASELLYLF